MKKLSKIFAFSLIAVITVMLVGCGKKANYDEYIGYQFSGKDPWGNSLAVTIRTLENDKLTWTYTDSIDNGENPITLYNELTTDFKEGSTSFNVKGNADVESISFDYTGKLTLENGKLTITYEKGQVTTDSTEGGSTSHNVDALDAKEKTITLTKVVDNS